MEVILGVFYRVVAKEYILILAFGDSITNGFGEEGDYSYPLVFHKKTGLEIINSGVDGEFTSEGLNRLSTILLKMVELIKKSRAEVLLVGVPNYYSQSFEVHELYKELATERKVPFENSVLTHIALDDSLK